MEYRDIQDFFEIHLKHLKIDKNLMKKLRTFRYGWATKNDDYIDFLGSNLYGVHMIRFSELDDEKLMHDVLKIRDYKALQKDIFNVKLIEKKYKVASNIIYQTLMYIGHKYVRSKLPADDKRDGVREVCLIMQYKMFTSLYSRRFIFTTPEHIAHTVYNKLSHKFLIKQLNSWQELFEYRVNICMDKATVNNEQLRKYDSKESINLLSAIQTKTRGAVNEVHSVFIDVLENDEAINSTSSTYIGGENDLEQGVDVTVSVGTYINRIKSIAQHKHDFIDMETIDLVSSMFGNLEKDLIIKFIKCMSDDDFIEHDKLNNIIDKVMLISFNYLQRSNINIAERKYIPKALVNIRFYWSSSKVRNQEMKDVKNELYNLSKICTGRKTNWLLITIVLSYITYLFLRSLKE